MSKRVLLGMSGGTDSSVSAMLLQKQGYEVIGVTFQLLEHDGSLKQQHENFPQYIVDAQNLAQKLDIQHYVLDLRDTFRTEIIDYFVDEYVSGRTPFPCVVCNNVIKWKYLLSEAKTLRCDYVATGHYVKKAYVNKYIHIEQGLDPEKDQSFFLWGMTQEVLEKCLFPLGEYTKETVRKIAIENGFPAIAKKKESMGVCFIEGTDYRPFLEEELSKRNISITNGNFVDSQGSIIGTHNGYPFYTVGQRRGLGLVPKEPIYVNEIRKESNEVVVGPRQELFRNEIYLTNYNLINETEILSKESVIVKIRYRKQATPGKIHKINNSTLRVELLEPLDAIASGQTAVFYEQSRVLGGGFII